MKKQKQPPFAPGTLRVRLALDEFRDNAWHPVRGDVLSFGTPPEMHAYAEALRRTEVRLEES